MGKDTAQLGIYFLGAWIFFLDSVSGLERPIVLDTNYCHTFIKVQAPTHLIKNFEAYTSWFDASGTSTPLLVEYHIKGGKVSGKNKRPSAWSFDEELRIKNIMASDQAYRLSGYDRGHLCMKEIGSFISPDADFNTHTLWNCLPQKHELNAGIWLDLEKKSIAWANRFGDVWVLCGPYFTNRNTAEKIGTSETGTISVPPFSWKILIRTNHFTVMAAMYPQTTTLKGPYDHQPYLLSVQDLENKTGLLFELPLTLKALTNDFKAFENEPFQ